MNDLKDKHSKNMVKKISKPAVNRNVDSQSPQLWDEVAETYAEEADSSELKLGHEIECLLADIGIKPGASLLEVGCGCGHLSGYLASKDFKTTLMDFSKVAIAKAKAYYEKHNLTGNFILCDMMELSTKKVEPHDVVWNSGVLEHFDSWQVIEVLKRMEKVSQKFVIILVPNSNSIPYLLFRRHAMENNEWLWGRELLRDSMRHHAEAANLEVLEERYMGHHYSPGHLGYVKSELGQEYKDMYQQNLIPDDQSYLIALVARPRSGKEIVGYEELVEKLLREEAIVAQKTYSFDLSAISNRLQKLQETMADLDSQLKEKNDEVESKNQEIGLLQETLHQRESSLSWRFSQFYGRYFSMDSRITRFISYLVNKIAHSLEHRNTVKTKGTKYYKQELENILKNHGGKVKGIIVYPPSVDWNIPLFQRPQQIALKLSDSGYLFFFSTASNEFDRVDGFYKVKDNCYITNQYDLLVKELPDFIFMLSSTNLVIRLEDILKIKDKVLIIYEYIDEIHQDISGSISIDYALHRHEYMIKKSDIVVATADKLLDDVTKIREKSVYLIPNGVEYEHFHIQKDYENIPSDIKSIIKKGNPIIGYYGAFAKWFDYELLKDMAKKRPNHEIVLIGWDYDGSMHNQRLKRFKNIHYLGIKKYPILPKYAVWFDVATIPFVLNRITESTSPIKIFEYMALGKPIVTTDLRECRKYKSVLIGKDYEDFIEKIDDALELRDDSAYLGLLDKEAKENTWEDRAREIDEAIRTEQDKSIYF